MSEPVFTGLSTEPVEVDDASVAVAGLPEPEPAVEPEPKLVEVELVKRPDVAALVTNLDPMSVQSLSESFAGMFQRAEEWKARAEQIQITDASQVDEIKEARKARLEIKALRVRSEKARKALKAESLARGRAIDGVANIFKFLVAPIEEHLKTQEEFVERQEAERKQKLKVEREQRLDPYRSVVPGDLSLADMGDQEFEALLSGAQSMFADQQAEAERQQAEAEAAAKAEAERRAAEQAERRRLEEENRRLREQQAREAEAAAKAAAERQAAERKRQEEADRKLREEQEKAQRARQEAERLQRAELARQQAEADRLNQIAQAPDKERLILFAQSVRSNLPSEASTEAGQKVTGIVSSKVGQFADWIERQAEQL